MSRRSRVSLLLALLLTAASSAAHAGRSCETKPMTVTTIQRAMLLAEHCRRARRQRRSGRRAGARGAEPERIRRALFAPRLRLPRRRALAHSSYTRTQAQAWLRLQGYEPTTLKISALKRLGARATAANVAFDDHPNEKRFTDRIETVTVDSVFAWLNRDGLGGPVQVIR